MANRYPLIVSTTSNKIEELGLSDNLNLTQNNIIANGAAGTNGQYLKSDGTKVVWDTPGNVYLTATQTLTNKTFTSCVISGSSNTLSNIPNSALSNSSITINGSAISLGGSVTTPNDNTTYNYASLVTQSNPTTRIALRLSGSDSTTDEIILEAGNNTTLTRTLISESGGNHSSLIRIDSSDTTNAYSAGNGLQLDGSSFSLKDNAALNDYFLTKWDNTNKRLVSSLIRQDPTTNDFSINGSSNFTVTSGYVQGAQLISSGNNITIRKGNGLLDTQDARFQVTRATTGSGVISLYTALQWYANGQYWRIDDGSPISEATSRALVTSTDLQTLTNKTLRLSTLEGPSLIAFGAQVPTASSLTVTTNLTVGNNITVTENAILNKVTRTNTGTLATSIPVVSGVATFDTASVTEFLGTLAAPVTGWRFENVDSTPNTSTEITLVLQGNPTNTYGDAVDIVAPGGASTVVTNGVRWEGGTPPPSTSGIDVLTFKIIVLFPLDYIVIGSYQTNNS